jgi:sugar O-acyltransferase (sialic acid O-acetyltransferase NeuD family)
VVSADKKTPDGREAYAEGNLVSRAVQAIKAAVPDIGIICDVALDPYTSHGHDGVVNEAGHVLNDLTVEVLVGQALNQARAGTVERVQADGYRCANYISSRAIVAGEVVPDSNTFVMELNNLQPFSRLGRNVWLWAGNHVGHHSTIGDHCFLASHVVVSGSVDVGESSFIGVNATIRDNVRIGARNVIGAGVVILADTRDAEVYIGPKTEASRVPSHRLRGI